MSTACLFGFSLNSDSEMDTDTDEHTGGVSVDNGSSLTQNQESSQLANGSGSGDAAVVVDEFSHNCGENVAMETEEGGRSLVCLSRLICFMSFSISMKYLLNTDVFSIVPLLTAVIYRGW